MKIALKKFFALMTLFGAAAYAGPNGPPPPGVPPPGLPIDGHVLIMVLIAVVFASYKIYKLQFNKKTPV